MEEILTMSNKEIDKLKVIQNVIHKQLTWVQAGHQLGLSDRQIGRLCARVRHKGNRGIIHGLRGRPSNHRLQPGLLAGALDKVRTLYPDFHPTFANEKLRDVHGLWLSTFTLRQGMIGEGLWKPRKHKAQHRTWRERRPCVGMLVQLDGSDHDWFEDRGPRCVLLIFIDDATSRILYGEFIPVEDTFHLLRAAKKYLLEQGRPVALYVDKDGIYKINRPPSIEEQLRDEEPLTQFSRAMKELGIEVITAHSPQAKGRVERSFKTHQDRLVKELRLAGISNREKATQFLRRVYIPRHNARFAVEPANPLNVHRALLPSHRLDEILSFRIERTVFNDFTLRCHNRFFQIVQKQSLRIHPGDKVIVETRLDGSVHLRAKGHELNFHLIKKRPYTPFYASCKKPSPLPRPSKPYRLPPNHPWRFFRMGKRAPHAAVQMAVLSKT